MVWDLKVSRGLGIVKKKEFGSESGLFDPKWFE